MLCFITDLHVKREKKSELSVVFTYVYKMHAGILITNTLPLAVLLCNVNGLFGQNQYEEENVYPNTEFHLLSCLYG